MDLWKARIHNRLWEIDRLGKALFRTESIRYDQEVFLTQIRSPFTSASAVSSSLRMIAMIATLAGFPA